MLDTSKYMTVPSSYSFVLMAICSLSGCDRQPPITSYEIPKEATVAQPVVEDAEGRMLVAMVTKEPKTWFFKLSGDNDAIAPHVDAFREFISDLNFVDDQPKWRLPEGWQEQAGSGMRYATLNVGSPGLGVSVIALPAPQPVLENVNRWRGQLQLTAIDESQLQETVEQLKLPDAEATWVDIRGSRPSGPGNMQSGVPPFMAGRPPVVAKQDQASESLRPSPGFEFQAPEDWTPGRLGVMRKLAFEVRQGDVAAEITVTTLGSAGAALLPNVNRWRTQLGLPSIDQTALDQSLKEIEMGGAQATYVEITGEGSSDGEDSQSTLVAILTRGDVAWFFKMMGDATVVAAEKEKFESFLRSVRFP